jgi:hypothetical protein
MTRPPIQPQLTLTWCPKLPEQWLESTGLWRRIPTRCGWMRNGGHFIIRAVLLLPRLTDLQQDDAKVVRSSRGNGERDQHFNGCDGRTPISERAGDVMIADDIGQTIATEK